MNTRKRKRIIISSVLLIANLLIGYFLFTHSGYSLKNLTFIYPGNSFFSPHFMFMIVTLAPIMGACGAILQGLGYDE